MDTQDAKIKTVKRKNFDELDLGPEFGGLTLLDDLVRKSLDYNSALDFRMRNPDQTLLDLGKTIRLYDDMMLDDAISSAIDIRKRMILSVPGEWRPASKNDPMDLEICEFVKQTFAALKLRLVDCMDNILNAMFQGFQVAEKIWEMEGDKVVLRNLKFIHPLLCDFEYDEFRNISSLHIGYYYGGQHMAIRGKDISDKFLIYSHPYPINGIYYGSSDLKPLYKLWNAKNNILNWRNMYLQNFAMPIAQVTYDQAMMSDDELAALEYTLDHLQENQRISIPATRNPTTGTLEAKAVVSFLEVAGKSGTNSEIYERAIDQLDKMIKRKLLLPDKLGFSESPGGSYSMSDNQLDILIKSVLFFHGRLEEVVNKELVRQLVDMNYPDVKIYPEWKFAKIDYKLTNDMLNTLLTNNVITADEDWIREFTNIPQKEIVDPDTKTDIQKTIPKQAATDKPMSPNAPGWIPSTTTQAGFPVANIPHQPTPGQGNIEQIGISSQPQPIGQTANATAPAPGTPAYQPPGLNNSGTVPQNSNPQQGGSYYPVGMSPIVSNKVNSPAMWQTFTRKNIHDVYNFESHKKDLETLEADFLKEYKKCWDDISADFVGQVQKRKIIENRDLSGFKKINLRKGEMKSLFQEYLAKCYLMGKVNAITQTKKRLKAANPCAFTKNYMKFKIDETDDEKSWLDPSWIDDYLKEYGELGLLTAADRAYLKTLKDKAFFITGETANRIYAMWQTVDNGLSSGLMARDIVAKLEQELNADREKYALTIARTNESTAYNAAMMNQYMSDSVRPTIEAYLFSAIMDDRTSDICAAQDGRIIEQGSGDVAEYTPPLHYNCRSVLIPVFIGENENEDSYFYSYRDKMNPINRNVKPLEGFGG